MRCTTRVFVFVVLVLFLTALHAVPPEKVVSQRVDASGQGWIMIEFRDGVVLVMWFLDLDGNGYFSERDRVLRSVLNP